MNAERLLPSALQFAYLLMTRAVLLAIPIFFRYHLKYISFIADNAASGRIYSHSYCYVEEHPAGG